MNVTLISCFRNMEDKLPRYFEQVGALEVALYDRDDNLTYIWGEGDSTDDTLQALQDYKQFCGFECNIVDASHGGGEYGSVVNPERFRQLGYVGRCMWAHIPQDADAILYVESDLIWSADVMLRLLDRLQEYPAVSPMVMLDRKPWPKDSFYDVEIFRKNGRKFTHEPPYCQGFDADKPFMVDSAGSCMCIRGDLAKGLIWDEQVFIGICKQLKEKGCGVFCDPTVSVIHE